MMAIAAGSDDPRGRHCLYHYGCKLALRLVQMLARSDDICD